jgi:hypothetical protein
MSDVLTVIRNVILHDAGDHHTQSTMIVKTFHLSEISRDWEVAISTFLSHLLQCSFEQLEIS